MGRLTKWRKFLRCILNPYLIKNCMLKGLLSPLKKMPYLTIIYFINALQVAVTYFLVP